MPYVERDQGGNIAAEYANPQAGKALEFVSDDAPELVAFRSPAPGYREQRKAEYITDLGKVPGNGFDDTVGDVLDIVITELYLRGQSQNPEFAGMVQKIAAIKAKYPKPERN